MNIDQKTFVILRRRARGHKAKGHEGLASMAGIGAMWALCAVAGWQFSVWPVLIFLAIRFSVNLFWFAINDLAADRLGNELYDREHAQPAVWM